ncbi:hypothetical protein O6H91_20G024500 [Diphasiastrum complanatum]|uniref:Uncharacterized protein n=1 Tax=Diphasiastrum complanatum TaxID=34168 RepID=A0ACC2ANL4_DIPCM|nr:hypothetical protein O6H91_20G024500 [Diphasiastrum complanatum]
MLITTFESNFTIAYIFFEDLFDLAKKIKPSIIFFDETDAFGLSRTSGDDISSRRILTEILVHIVGATNRIQDVDEALKRRFDLRIEVPLPDQCTRTMIVRLYMSQTYAELSEADYRRISDETEGYSGSDLKSVCRIAAMQPVKEFMRSLDIKMLDTVDVTKLKRQIRSCSIADFQNALTLYLPHGSTGNTPQQRSGLL